MGNDVDEGKSVPNLFIMKKCYFFLNFYLFQQKGILKKFDSFILLIYITFTSSSDRKYS